MPYPAFRSRCFADRCGGRKRLYQRRRSRTRRPQSALGWYRRHRSKNLRPENWGFVGGGPWAYIIASLRSCGRPSSINVTTPIPLMSAIIQSFVGIPHKTGAPSLWLSARRLFLFFRRVKCRRTTPGFDPRLRVNAVVSCPISETRADRM